MKSIKEFIKKRVSNKTILLSKFMLGRTGFPKTLRIDITAFCNAKCPFCPRVAMPESRASGKMPIEKFTSIIEEAKVFGIKTLKLYITSEPLLHPDFSKFVNVAVENKIDVQISTNLSVLQHRLNDLRDISKLQLSIEGWDKESYEKYRFPLKYDRAKNNYDFLVKDPFLKKIHKEIHLPITKATNLEKFFHLWGDVDAIRIDFMQPYNDFDKTKNRFTSKYPLQLQNEIYELTETTDKICYDPFDEIVIGFDGKIHLCCLDFHAELPLGNIENGFSNVLHNFKRKSIQKEFLSGKVDTCNGCSQLMRANQDQKNTVKETINKAWNKVKPNAKIIFYEDLWMK